MSNIFSSVFSSVSACSMAIDLGTINTLVALRGYGVVLEEASAVAVSTGKEGDIFAVGDEAVKMFGRTPYGIQLKFPFRRGVIADFTLAECMIRSFIEKVSIEYAKALRVLGPRLLLCVPGCITEVERRALEEAARRAGARDVLIMEEALAAAIGAGLPYNEPTASLIVDIGGGTTDIAVVTLGGIAAQKSIRMGGNTMDEEIIACVRHNHNLLIGSKTSERLKIAFGTGNEGEPLSVRGLNLTRNLPESATIQPDEIHKALERPIEQIIYAIHEVISITPPELAGDIMKNGITLTGGGAMLSGLSEKIAEAINIPTFISNTPLQTVALGALKALESLQTRRDIQMFREYPSLAGQ